MKFYYDDIGYECTWRNNLKGSITSWSNMEFAKIKVRIPLSLYRKILFDLKEFDGDEPELEFKIYKLKGEDVNWGTYSTDEAELWRFTTLLQRLSYSSEFNDGTVMAQIECLVQYNDMCSKAELRDLILNELI
jgi:hypothetical protein